MRARLQRDSARSLSKEAFSDNWPPNQCMLGVSIDASGSIMILHSLDFKFRFMYSYKNLPFGTFNMSKKTIFPSSFLSSACSGVAIHRKFTNYTHSKGMLVESRITFTVPSVSILNPGLE